MPPTRVKKTVRTDSNELEPTPARRLVKRGQPLPKGSACIPCAARRVRCSGERPACAACIRHAEWQGSGAHGCSYRAIFKEEEEEEEEEEVKVEVEQEEVLTELEAARRKISELEQKIAELETKPSQAAVTATEIDFNSYFALDASPTTNQSSSEQGNLSYTANAAPTSSSSLTPSQITVSPLNPDLVFPSFGSTSIDPAALSLSLSQLSKNTALHHSSCDFTLFPFTPPPSTDVSPMPTFHDVPATLSGLFSVHVDSTKGQLRLQDMFTVAGTPPTSVSGEMEVQQLAVESSDQSQEGEKSKDTGKLSLWNTFGW